MLPPLPLGSAHCPLDSTTAVLLTPMLAAFTFLVFCDLQNIAHTNSCLDVSILPVRSISYKVMIVFWFSLWFRVIKAKTAEVVRVPESWDRDPAWALTFTYPGYAAIVLSTLFLGIRVSMTSPPKFPFFNDSDRSTNNVISSIQRSSGLWLWEEVTEFLILLFSSILRCAWYSVLWLLRWKLKVKEIMPCSSIST